MEAILEHGGEAQDSTAKVRLLADSEQADLIAFLDNLVLYKVIEDDAMVVDHFPHRQRSTNRGRDQRPARSRGQRTR